MTPFVEEWRKQRDILKQMTVERSVDEAAYAVQVAHVESLTTKLRESRTTMLYHIYRLLTPEQYKKLRGRARPPLSNAGAADALEISIRLAAGHSSRRPHGVRHGDAS